MELAAELQVPRGVAGIERPSELLGQRFVQTSAVPGSVGASQLVLFDMQPHKPVASREVEVDGLERLRPESLVDFTYPLE